MFPYHVNCIEFYFMIPFILTIMHVTHQIVYPGYQITVNNKHVFLQQQQKIIIEEMYGNKCI